MDTYRVLMITTDNFSLNTQPITNVVWEGTSLNELSKRFPRSDIMGADQLGYHQIEDGWISWYHRFEKCSDVGEWQEIKDPRHKVYDPKQEVLEAAIDAENRRLFPDDCDDEFAYENEDDYEDYYKNDC